MKLFSYNGRAALAATVVGFLVVASTAASAQPTLTGASVFHASADGTSFNTAWRSDGGVPGVYSQLFLTTLSDADFSAASVLNPGVSGLNQQLTLGSNTFFFYGSATASFSTFGLNLWFVPPADYTCATLPGLSAYVAPGPAGVRTANASTNTASRCVTNNPAGPLQGSLSVQGAGSLSFSSGEFVVSLTDFRVLADGTLSGAFPSTIDRVGATSVGSDNLLDTYGTFTLEVTASEVPEPNSAALLLFGLLGLVATRRSGRRARVA